VHGNLDDLVPRWTPLEGTAPSPDATLDLAVRVLLDDQADDGSGR
jgi:hypothetical protein